MQTLLLRILEAQFLRAVMGTAPSAHAIFEAIMGLKAPAIPLGVSIRGCHCPGACSLLPIATGPARGDGERRVHLPRTLR